MDIEAYNAKKILETGGGGGDGGGGGGGGPMSIEVLKAMLSKNKKSEVSERSKRASLDEDENTRDESRSMATDIMATSTTELTHSILLTRRSPNNRHRREAIITKTTTIVMRRALQL